MNRQDDKMRVVVAKSETDAHDRGARYVAKELSDAGMEVIFIRYSVIDEVANTALQEDVDAICLSFLSGGHQYDVPRIMELLAEKKLGHVPVLIGGFIPPSEVPGLLDTGVKDYYGPGSDLSQLVGYLRGESETPEGKP